MGTGRSRDKNEEENEKNNSSKSEETSKSSGEGKSFEDNSQSHEPSVTVTEAGKLESSRMSGVIPPNMRDLGFNNECPLSFQAFSPLHHIPAFVNITDASGTFHRYQDINRKFSTIVHLVRNSDFYYIEVISSRGAGQRARLKLKKMSNFREDDLPNTIYCEFESIKSFVKVEFKRKERYLFFCKILEAIHQINNQNGVKIFYPCNNLVTFEVKDDSAVMKPLKQTIRLSTKFSYSTRGNQFYREPTIKWRETHYKFFTKYIFIQKEGENRIRDVFTWISGPEIMPGFINYFRLYEGNWVTLIQDIKTYFEEKTPFPDTEVVKSKKNLRVRSIELILSDEDLCKVFKKECLKIKKNRIGAEHFFDMAYHLVLSKRIKCCEEKVHEGKLKLVDIENELDHEKKYLWSITHCKFFILSLLLYNCPMKIWVENLTKEFKLLEEDTFREKIEEKFSDQKMIFQWTDNERHLEIDDIEWANMLDEFNKKNGVKMEKLSFEVHIKNKQNNLRKKKRLEIEEELKKQQSEKEKLSKFLDKKKEIEDCIVKAISAKERKEKLLGRLEDRLEKLESDTPAAKNFKKKFEEVAKQLSACDIEINEYNKHKKNIDSKILEISEISGEESKNLLALSLNSLNKIGFIQKINKDIMTCIPECFNTTYRNEKFYNTSKREKYIQQHLEEKLKERSVQGMSEFGVKLVISIKKGHQVGFKRNLIAFVDKFVTPGFYKWGLIHSKVQLMNVGLDWFSDSLVTITDLQISTGYEEVVAIDAHCPLIVNSKTVDAQLMKLAETLVKANINYNYSLCNVFSDGSNENLNCQEFTFKIIKSLEYTPFFKEVEEYLHELRRKLEKMDIMEGTNLKFLNCSKQFKKDFFTSSSKYKKYIKTEEFHPGKDDKIYFRSHSDLDMFYRELQGVDDYFELNYPGIHQLLKGFDRAFWMRYRRCCESSDRKELEHLEFVRPMVSSVCPFLCRAEIEEYKKLVPKKSSNSKEEEIEGEGEL